MDKTTVSIMFQPARDERGRLLELPAALRANLIKPGESRNPTGKSGEYTKCMTLCRQKSLAAAERLIALAELDCVNQNGRLAPLSRDADPRVAMMAAQWVYERAWGKVKDYDPSKDAAGPLEFDPSKLSVRQLAAVKKAMLVLLAASVPAEAEGEAPK